MAIKVSSHEHFPVTLKMFYIWYMENCKQYLKSGLSFCLEAHWLDILPMLFVQCDLLFSFSPLILSNSTNI